MTAPAGANPPEFATFWHGPLHAIAYSCLASFPHVGAGLRLYSYEDKIDPPPGVDLADARQICPDPSLLGRYIAAGKPSIAKFADMFRYKLIRDTGCCWVDTDMLTKGAGPGLAPADPRNGTSPKVKIPPSRARSQ